MKSNQMRSKRRSNFLQNDRKRKKNITRKRMPIIKSL